MGNKDWKSSKQRRKIKTTVFLFAATWNMQKIRSQGVLKEKRCATIIYEKKGPDRTIIRIK